MKLQIRNIDKDGSGSFYYVEAPDNTTDYDLGNLISDMLTEKKERHELFRYFMWKPLFSNRRMKIVEIVKDKGCGWVTKRGGKKGYVYLSTIKLSGKNIITGESFKREYGSFDVVFEGGNR